MLNSPELKGAALAARLSEEALQSAVATALERERLIKQWRLLPWWRWKAKRQLMAEIRFHEDEALRYIWVSEMLDGDA